VDRTSGSDFPPLNAAASSAAAMAAWGRTQGFDVDELTDADGCNVTLAEFFSRVRKIIDKRVYDQLERLRRFLDKVEAEMGSYNEPFNERTPVWLQLVRDELGRSNPYIEILGGSMTVPSWASWPPEWWPAAIDSEPTSAPQIWPSLSGRSDPRTEAPEIYPAADDTHR